MLTEELLNEKVLNGLVSNSFKKASCVLKENTSKIRRMLPMILQNDFCFIF